jgi:hypothetical protein
MHRRIPHFTAPATSDEQVRRAAVEEKIIPDTNDSSHDPEIGKPKPRKRRRSQKVTALSSFYRFADSHFKLGVNRCLIVSNVFLVIMICFGLIAVFQMRQQHTGLFSEMSTYAPSSPYASQEVYDHQSDQKGSMWQG